MGPIGESFVGKRSLIKPIIKVYKWYKILHQDIIDGKEVRLPVYDFRTHSRVSGKCMVIGPGRHEVVIVEGILVFYWARIRNVFNLKLFVDTDPDTRLARWGEMSETERVFR